LPRRRRGQLSHPAGCVAAGLTYRTRLEPGYALRPTCELASAGGGRGVPSRSTAQLHPVPCQGCSTKADGDDVHISYRIKTSDQSEQGTEGCAPRARTHRRPRSDGATPPPAPAKACPPDLRVEASTAPRRGAVASAPAPRAFGQPRVPRGCQTGPPSAAVEQCFASSSSRM
jgi:hypothetical protein